MGSTTGARNVQVNKPLSNVAIAYRPMGMIADKVAPIVQVPKQSGAYYVWNKADALRIENDQRAPGTKANIITRAMESGTYFAKNYALADLVPYEDIENADAGYLFTERGSRVENIMDKLHLSWEQRLANTVNSTSNVGSSASVSSAWSDSTAGNSDPIGDVNTAIYNVQDSTGWRPNRIIFSQTGWRNFREHADVVDRIYGNVTNGKAARVVTIENVKALFEVDEVLIGGAYYNSADEGQSQTLTQLWGENVLVYYAPMRARKDTPSFMYTYRWNKVMTMQAQVYQLPEEKAEKVEAGYYQDEKITASDLSFLITNTNSL